MTRRQRFEQKLADLEKIRLKLRQQGRFLEVQEYDKKIADMERNIEICKDYEAKAVREILSDKEIEESCLVPLLLEAHLMSDVLAEVCYNIVDIFKKRGLTALTLVPEIQEILKRSSIFASILCTKNEQLNSLLIDNEKLLHDVHLICQRYIKERME